MQFNRVICFLYIWLYFERIVVNASVKHALPSVFSGMLASYISKMC